MNSSAVADLVVVGGGTLGGWASYFAKTSGAERVVVVESGLLGQGASSRAAGIVRSQGGTPATVALGQWSIDFYNRQQELLGTDSGFTELGYLLLAITPEDETEGRRRVEMQRSCGLDVEWLSAETATEVCSTLAPGAHRGGSYVATDGAINPPRNVLAYALAMSQSGVEVRERIAFTGLRTAESADGSVRVTGVETSAGFIETERVIITGGPTLQAVGRLAGTRIPVGGARHQVAVTEPHEAFQTGRQPMVFDLGAGLYWRLEEDGLLFGMSNPAESPGQATEIDWPYLEKMQKRLARLVPATSGLKLRKVWAATIDYTPDHLPILGPALTAAGEPIEGTTVASAGGHGMMWGPAVARAAADLALEGKTALIDVAELGLDRFDERGRSKLQTDPIALPFPITTGDL